MCSHPGQSTPHPPTLTIPCISFTRLISLHQLSFSLHCVSPGNRFDPYAPRGMWSLFKNKKWMFSPFAREYIKYVIWFPPLSRLRASCSESCLRWSGAPFCLQVYLICVTFLLHSQYTSILYKPKGSYIALKCIITISTTPPFPACLLVCCAWS